MSRFLIAPNRGALVCALTLLALVFAAGSPAFAQGLAKWTDAELAAFARVIVTGRVVSVESAWDTEINGIYTYVTLEIGEVAKGWVPERRVTLKQAGGRVGDIGLMVPDQAEFVVGEEVLVFLERRPRDRALYTAALWQGKWTIERNALTGEGVAIRLPPTRRPGDRSGPPADVDVAESRDERPLRPFLAELRAWSGERSRRPSRGSEAFTTHPAETPTVSTSDVDGAPETSADDPAISSDAEAFTLFNPARRWHEPDSSTPVRVDVQSGGQSGLGGGGLSEINDARGLWNASGSALQLADGTARSARCFNTFEGDGRLSIAFMDPCGEIDDSGGTLAIGGAWYSGSASNERVVNGTTFAKIIQGGVVNNNSAAALNFLQSPRCFQDIQTHELGHAIGLGHTGTAGNIMQPFINNACFSAGAGMPLGGDDIAGVSFVYPGVASAPGKPMTTSPLGSIADSTPTYSWSESSGATQYRVVINSNGGASNFEDHTVDAADVCSGGTCSLDSPPVATLAEGDYRWWVKASNSVGSSSWSASKDFTFTLPAPSSAPVLASPSGDITNPVPTYSWSAVSEATQYRLVVNSNSGASNFEDHTVNAADVCSGSTCSLASPPVAALANGSYVWWVRGSNSAGTGPWSAGTSVSVVAARPNTAPTLTSPSGSITNPMQTYSWSAVAGATKYRIAINSNGGATNFDDVLVNAADVCSGASCSMGAPPASALPDGSYVWWVQATNGGGTGPWSSGTAFSVAAVRPTTAPNPISPSGTTTDATPTYIWSAVPGATQYRVAINSNSGATNFDDQLANATSVCSDGVCSLTSPPASSLADGAYRWWVQGRNSAGPGPWSVGTDITKQ